MPGPSSRCGVCRSPDRKAIDAAILAGTSLRQIATAWGMNRGPVTRHSRHVRTGKSKPQLVREKAQALVLPDPQPVSLSEKSDVIAEMEKNYAHQMQMYERGLAIGDNRLASRSLDQAAAVLRDFARLHSLFAEGVVINFNAQAAADRMEKVIGNMSEVEMRAWLTSNTDQKVLAEKQLAIQEHKELYNPRNVTPDARRESDDDE